ncbi:hypothetical protein ACJX0J_027937, partial [Zea mays]
SATQEAQRIIMGQLGSTSKQAQPQLIAFELPEFCHKIYAALLEYGFFKAFIKRRWGSGPNEKGFFDDEMGQMDLKLDIFSLGDTSKWLGMHLDCILDIESVVSGTSKSPNVSSGTLLFLTF